MSVPLAVSLRLWFLPLTVYWLAFEEAPEVGFPSRFQVDDALATADRAIRHRAALMVAASKGAAAGEVGILVFSCR